MRPVVLREMAETLRAATPVEERISTALAWARRGVGHLRPAHQVLGRFLHHKHWWQLSETASSDTVDPTPLLTAAVQGLHGHGQPTLLAFHATNPGCTEVMVGLPDTDAAPHWLSGTAPDLGWTPAANPFPPHLTSPEAYDLFLLPRPAPHDISNSIDGLSFLERMLRLPQSPWSALLLLEPTPRHELLQAQHSVAEARDVVARAHHITASTSETASVSITNPHADALMLRLDCWDELISDGLRHGMWDVRVHVTSPDNSIVQQVAAQWSGAVGPEASHLPRGRFHEWDVADTLPPQQGTEQHSPDDTGWLPSRDVACLLSPPSVAAGTVTVREPLPAGRISPATERPLQLGRWAGTTLPALVDVDDVAGHMFVAGTTGSGKSTTVTSLLAQLWNAHGIPFLIIDPAKGDHANNSGLFDGGLRVVSGSEIRLNALQPWPGGDPVRHIGHVAAAFRGCFGMPSPVPYVASLLFDEAAAIAVSGQAPSLHDVSARLDTLSTELGYEGEIVGNIRASLGLRLRMLLEPHRADRVASGGVPTWLLERPTLVQLSDVGDEEERLFLSALLVLLIADAARARPPHGGVQHVTVVEEAHRLMPEPDRQGSPELGDPASVVSGLMAQLLAEIRGYGESVWVVDQSPAGVAREVIRNTNVKVAHRIMDLADQEVLGGSLGLSADSHRLLGSLSTGRAVVGTRRLLRPQTVEVEPPPASDTAQVLPLPQPLEQPCHPGDRAYAHHVSEQAGAAAELRVAVWAMGIDDAHLLDWLDAVSSALPHSRSECLARVGIRRHVATLHRWGILGPDDAAAHGERMWDASRRREAAPAHPAGNGHQGTLPHDCPRGCRARPVVESGGLKGLQSVGAAVAMLPPSDAVRRIDSCVNAVMQDLELWCSPDTATEVGRCLLHRFGQHHGLTAPLFRVPPS